MIDYRIRRRQPDEPSGAPHPELGQLVSKITCSDCGRTVCVAQTNDWPPTGPVTLRIGPDWPEPQIVGNNVLCGDCGGQTVNGA